jgi:hypothetical protein
VKANYLASPPLVVAYAIAGTTDIDLATEPLGKDMHGQDVYLFRQGCRSSRFKLGLRVVAFAAGGDQFIDRFGVLSVGASVGSRTSYGGTAPDRVREQIAKAKADLGL